MTQKLMFHIVTYHGKDGKSRPGYLSIDPLVIADQLTAIQKLGGSGAVALTYGPYVSMFMHQASMEICRQCSERRMLFALCYDPWTVKNTPDVNAAMDKVLQNPDTQTMLNSRAYIPERAVLDFSTGVDPTKLKTQGVGYWMKHIQFSWPEITNTLETLAKDNSNPQMKMPGVFTRFFDGDPTNYNNSVWGGPVRVIDSEGGDMLAKSILSADTAVNAPYRQYVTWNDYAEGTEIEPFTAAMLEGGFGGGV
jgi:hypothetical protein